MAISVSLGIGGAVVAFVGAVVAMGKLTQRQNDINDRLSHVEDMLSWSGDKGPAFVHKSLFDLQNTHNEQMIAELRGGLGKLESKLDQKLDETNKLLAEIAASLG